MITDEELFSKEWPQNCGDTLKVLEKTNESGKYLFRCQFIKYFYIIFKTKSEIIKGSCLNPRIEEEEFVKKEWLQKCGDILIIQNKILSGENKGKFKCIFKNFSFEVIASKINILQGKVYNYGIENQNFINKIWPQNCGDLIKILRKTNITTEGKSKNFLFHCKFIKYPYEILATKDNIIKGKVVNPQIEIEDFVNKEWLQKCGDSIKIIKKVIIFNNNNKVKKKEYNWECIFIKSKIRIIASKEQIILGNCKPFYKFTNSLEEESLRNYIKNIYNNIIITFHGKKEDHYYEIDIYFPELKIGFEYNGSVYHQEGNNCKFSKPKNYHKNKFEYFLKKGILIFNIWDYFWFEDKNHTIIRKEAKQYIKNIIQAFILKLPIF